MWNKGQPHSCPVIWEETLLAFKMLPLLRTAIYYGTGGYKEGNKVPDIVTNAKRSCLANKLSKGTAGNTSMWELESLAWVVQEVPQHATFNCGSSCKRGKVNSGLWTLFLCPQPSTPSCSYPVRVCLGDSCKICPLNVLTQHKVPFITAQKLAIYHDNHHY